jgi:ring-1,2-phenylacetyl-CoA epoxidase subunit PaaA
MQGDSEYSGALGYAPWVEKAPTLKEKVLVAQIVKDEM